MQSNYIGGTTYGTSTGKIFDCSDCSDAQHRHGDRSEQDGDVSARNLGPLVPWLVVSATENLKKSEEEVLEDTLKKFVEYLIVTVALVIIHHLL